MILAYIISNSAEEAEQIALDLLEKQLVFSVNIISNIRSMRREKDKITSLSRTIVLAKTKSLLYKEIEDEVKRVQTTGTAIVFSMPITQMSQDLFDSIQANTLKV
ncbi:MAG: divalent-cation tolerance protein CutA [Bacteroidales bacterium]|nr:divalent-cation tolerance protein CutA [Bacteroidales bacterium]